LTDAAKVDYLAEWPNTSTAASARIGAGDVSPFKPVYRRGCGRRRSVWTARPGQVERPRSGLDRVGLTMTASMSHNANTLADARGS
jgi:hypothetical protein